MKILPPVLVLIFVVAMGLLYTFLPGPTIVRNPYNWLGLVLIVAGLGVTVSAPGTSVASRQTSRRSTSRRSWSPTGFSDGAAIRCISASSLS